MRAALRGGVILIGLLAAVFTAFVIAVDHPTTRGPLRCWLQETFYTQSWEAPPPGTPVIEARRTTEPVSDMCDAADDPAIWVGDQAPGNALILGTNKQSRLNVYDLSGARLAGTDHIGEPNNVDIRAYKSRVLALASDKSDAEIEAYQIDRASGYLQSVDGAPFPARIEDEVYGLCLYQASEAFYAFTTDKSGLIVQYELELDRPEGRASEVRAFRVASQPEGCVVDDERGALFVGEEDIGIWRFDARADATNKGTLIAETSPNGPLIADVEGLTLYRGADGKGFLIASSQGDNTYAIFDRLPPHAFRGKFQVSYQGQIIGDTDGLEVTSTPLGSDYPRGLLVVQDGFIRDETGARRNQRFAYISWADVERELDL